MIIIFAQQHEQSNREYLVSVCWYREDKDERERSSLVRCMQAKGLRLKHDVVESILQPTVTTIA
jgi:hypothetical protein